MNIIYKKTLAITLAAALTAFSHESISKEFYFGLGVGQTSLTPKKEKIISEYESVNENSSLSNKATSLKLFTGYEFDDYLAIESELLTVGDIVAKENGVSNKLFNVSSLTVLGVVGKDITDNIRLFTKLGGHLCTVDDDSKSDKPMDSAVDLTYGAGVEVNLYGDTSRQLRAQVNRYNFDDVYLHSGYIASVDIIFYFGLPTQN